MDLKRVVVTGLGALTPIGNTVKEFKQALFEGVSGADTITRFDPSNFKTKFACELKGYDPLDYFERKEARRLDIYAQYALITSEEAVKDAGLVPEELDVDRIGVIMSSGIGGLHTFEQEIIGFTENNFVPRFNPFFIPKMISDIASGHVSMRYGFRGPNYGTVAACATATMSIANAFDHIRLGRANVMVVGGSEGSVTRVGVGGFNAMHAISTCNDDPKTASRPFDVDRDGFVMGEGAATLILEEYEHAKARGAKIYAELSGYGANSDGFDMVQPSGEGGVRCMQQALATVDRPVDYINTHGTSTPVGDVKELAGIREVFKDYDTLPYFNSTKSLTGHSLGATGVQEAIYSLLMTDNDFICASAHIEDLEPEVGDMPIVLERMDDVDIKCALSNSFGFGGTNACLVFTKLDA